MCSLSYAVSWGSVYDNSSCQWVECSLGTCIMVLGGDEDNKSKPKPGTYGGFSTSWDHYKVEIWVLWTQGTTKYLVCVLENYTTPLLDIGLCCLWVVFGAIGIARLALVSEIHVVGPMHVLWSSHCVYIFCLSDRWASGEMINTETDQTILFRVAWYLCSMCFGVN